MGQEPGSAPVPGPRVKPEYEIALARGFSAVRSQNGSILAALGAIPIGEQRYEMPVLDRRTIIDLAAGTVSSASGQPDVTMTWRILALHYLSSKPPDRPFRQWMGFADFPDGRTYEKVYRGRVLARLCATAGRDRPTFVEACQRLGGQRIVEGDEGFRFQVFPLLAIAIAWYAGDGEFPPSASFLLPDNALDFLTTEDLVVLSENVVGRLHGSKGR